MNKNRINTVWKSFNSLLLHGYPESKIDCCRMMLDYDSRLKRKQPHSANAIAFAEAMAIRERRALLDPPHGT